MPELTIRRVENKRTQQLTELWRAAFPSDTLDYIDGFFAHLGQDTVTLVGECNGDVVTMLFLLPAEARFRAKRYPVRYLYAGCTHPQHRGHGYYRQLMNAAAQMVAAMGENAIYLHPADERLTDTYKRLGYRSGVYGFSMKIIPSPTACASVDAYIQKRNVVIDGISQEAVFWNVADDTARFFVADASARGAKMALSNDGVVLTFENVTVELISTDGQRENADYCLWLPIGDSPLTALMKEIDGITGLVGD